MARQVKDETRARDTAREVLKETESFSNLAKKKINHANLKDYAMNSVVTLEWDLNKDAIQDRIFRIRINGEEALLDWEEFLHYARLI